MPLLRKIQIETTDVVRAGFDLIEAHSVADGNHREDNQGAIWITLMAMFTPVKPVSPL